MSTQQTPGPSNARAGSRRRWNRFRPFLPVALLGLVCLTAGGMLENPILVPQIESDSMRASIVASLRAIGATALTASLIAPAVTRRVQQKSNRELLEGVFQVMLGVNVPSWFTGPLASCIASIKRITDFRHWRLRLDIVGDNVVEAKVVSLAHGTNITMQDFVFEDLRAPASVDPYQTSFDQIVLKARGEDNPLPVHLTEGSLADSIEQDGDGRVRVSLRGHRDRSTVRPGGAYSLEQHYVVYCPTNWEYLLESYGAHREQQIHIEGPAVARLDIRVLHANAQLHPEVHGDGSLTYTIGYTTFPGQTTVVSWRPKPTAGPTSAISSATRMHQPPARHGAAW